jgi:N-methylhydantoinase B/oxoprolinase/acetone carboxylase alpha subunit
VVDDVQEDRTASHDTVFSRNEFEADRLVQGVVRLGSSPVNQPIVVAFLRVLQLIEVLVKAEIPCSKSMWAPFQMCLPDQIDM